jgi:hypothetical protein
MSTARNSALVLAIALIAAPPSVPANGRIMVSEGNTSLIRGDESLRGTRGTPIASGDVLVTGNSSDLQLWMQDDAMLVLGADSRLRLRGETPETRKSAYALEGGAVRMITGAYQPTMHTQMGEVVAFGTDFSTVICTNQCGGNAPGLYVKVDKGEVGASNAHGSVRTGPGQFIFVANADTAPVLINPPEADLPILLARLDFNLDLVDLNLEVVVLPTSPDLPVDPSPSTPP